MITEEKYYMQSRNEASNNKSLDDLIKEMYTDILPFIDGSPDELIRALGLALDSDTCGYFQWNIHRFLRDLSPLLDTAKKLGNKPKLPEDASMRLAIIGEKFNSLFSLMLDMLQKDSEHVIENKIKEFLTIWDTKA